MNYEQIIKKLSQELLRLDGTSVELTEIISSKSINRFEIYKKNYLHLVFGRLSEDFPGTKKYIGENNFYFFVQKLLKEKGLTSPYIFEVSKQFKKFIIESNESQNDSLLTELVKVDLMWSQSLDGEIEVPSGLLEYWQGLMTGNDLNKIINFDIMVKLKVFDYQGEQAFQVVR